MTVEDGRRLLISNLDLTSAYAKEVKVEDCKQPPPPLPAVRQLPVNSSNTILAGPTPLPISPVSLSGIEFFKVFCTAEDYNIFLSTAARMIASFPFVSPAVNLPSVPPVRVV